MAEDSGEVSRLHRIPCQNFCTSADDGRSCKRKPTWYLGLLFFFFFNVLLPTADVASDLTTAIKTHFSHGHWHWGAFTIILVLAPAIIRMFLTLKKVWKKENEVSLWDSVWLLPGFQTYKSVQLFSSLIKARNNLKKETKIKFESAEYIRLETYFEALPQLILQCYIFCRTGIRDFWQPLGIVLSYTSLASTSTLSFCLYDLSGKGHYISPDIKIRLFLLPVMGFSYLGPLVAFFLSILYQPFYSLVPFFFLSMFYFQNPVLLMQNLTKRITHRNCQLVVQVLIVTAVLLLFFALEYALATCDSLQIETKPLTFCYTLESLRENNLTIVENLTETNFFPNVFKVLNNKDNNSTVRLCGDKESPNDMFHKYLFPSSLGFVVLSLVFVWIGNRLKHPKILLKWTYWMTYFKMTPIIHVDVFKDILSEAPTLDPTSSSTSEAPTSSTSAAPTSSTSAAPTSTSTATSTPSSVTFVSTSSTLLIITGDIPLTSSVPTSTTQSRLQELEFLLKSDRKAMNLQDLNTGDTPMHFALNLNRWEELSLMILKYGGDVSICNFDFPPDFPPVGKSVLELLHESTNPEAESLSSNLNTKYIWDKERKVARRRCDCERGRPGIPQ